MARALYRKYRSKSLDEIVGQRHITDILKKAIDAGRVSHAYLLTGPRGVGKTSVARILAHEINKLPYAEEATHLDIIEIDAASNNGVDDVRDLREKVQLAPVSADKKVYIIDEVHMLSKPAFNALLKTLEEPPAHVVFILATTDLDKLPATIVSRTQRFGFRSVAHEEVVAHLKHIAKEEKIKIADDALDMIARRGEGSFRDSISLLDQLASLADEKTGITLELVEQTLGLAPDATVHELLKSAQAHDIAAIAATLKTASGQGINPSTLAGQIASAITEHLDSQPELLQLLDQLLDVPRSTQPQIKLLTVLGSYAAPKPHKTVALATPVREVTATIDELSKKATQKKPAEPVQPSKLAKASTSSEPPQPENPQDSLSEDRSREVASLQPFDGKALVEEARQNYVALYSVLSKCQFSLDGEELLIYTGNAFYKKKLDDAKYSPQLYQALSAIGCHNLTVETIATQPPMKNSQAAAIADMMGGGVEVALDADAPAAA